MINTVSESLLMCLRFLRLYKSTHIKIEGKWIIELYQNNKLNFLNFSEFDSFSFVTDFNVVFSSVSNDSDT